MIEKLTTTLINDFNPKFLAFDFFEDNINIVISSDCFINQIVTDRVRSVFFCIEKKLPETFEKYGVFVHTFTEEELVEVLEVLNQEGTE